jgi:hypothetical protein
VLRRRLRCAGLLIQRSTSGKVALQRAHKRHEVLRTAAGDQVSVPNHLLVEPGCAGIHQVIANSRPTGQDASVQKSRRREHPGAVAEGCNRLVGRIESPNEVASLGRLSQHVGIDESARNEQAVVVSRVGFRKSLVYVHLVCRLV